MSWNAFNIIEADLLEIDLQSGWYQISREPNTRLSDKLSKWKWTIVAQKIPENVRSKWKPFSPKHTNVQKTFSAEARKKLSARK